MFLWLFCQGKCLVSVAFILKKFKVIDDVPLRLGNPGSETDSQSLDKLFN